MLLRLGPVEYFNQSPTAQAPGVKEFLENPAHRAFLEKMLAHNNTQWLADSLMMSTVDVPADMERLLTASRVRRLPEMKTRLLFVVGSLDKVFLPMAEFFREKVPQAQVEVVPGATHLINVDSKDVVNARILKFVETTAHQAED